MPLMTSWVESANAPDTPFPLNNLPYGGYSLGDDARRLGVAIGDRILDVAAIAKWLPVENGILTDPRGWNGVMEAGPRCWSDLRGALLELLAEGSPAEPDIAPHLMMMGAATLHLHGRGIHRLLRRPPPRHQCGHHVSRGGERAAAQLAAYPHRL